MKICKITAIYLRQSDLFWRRAAFYALMNQSEKTADSARIHIRFTLTNGNNEEQELVLQRREGKWEIAEFIRPEQRQPT